jgi:hypothetical protein
MQMEEVERKISTHSGSILNAHCRRQHMPPSSLAYGLSSTLALLPRRHAELWPASPRSMPY